MQFIRDIQLRWQYRWSPQLWVIRTRPNHWFQRARRGWSDYDNASIDTHVSEILAGAITQMLEVQHGHACIHHTEEYNEATHSYCPTACGCAEEYNAILTRIAIGMDAMAQDDFFMEPQPKDEYSRSVYRYMDTYEEVNAFDKETLALLAEWYQSLWT